MCRGRLYHKSGWSRVYNDNGQMLELYQDKKSKDYSFVESAGVMSVNQVSEGWVYAISEVLLPNIGKIRIIFFPKSKLICEQQRSIIG